MLESSTLVIVLLQFIALMLVICGVLCWWVWRLRKQCGRLMDACRRMRSSRPPVRTDLPAAQPETIASPPSLEHPWRTLCEQTLQRYQHLTGKTLGDYSQDDPFSARIASVRYQYLQAEEAAAQQDTEARVWLTLEKRLAQLITVLLNNAKPVVAQEPDQVTLLRQRVKALRKVEDENKHLQRENSAFAKRLEQLGGYRDKYQSLMRQLRKALPGAELTQLLQAQQKHHGLVEQLHHYVEEDAAELYQDKRPVLGHIAELHDLASDSQSYVHEMKQASQQQAQFELMEQLRSNNKMQRQTIVQLRKELQCLRRAMEEQEHEGDSEEVQRLEKLVRETESCVATLESEVDFLQEKLSHQSADPVVEADPVLQQLKYFAANVVLQTSRQGIAALLISVFNQLGWQAAFLLTDESEESFYNGSERDDAHIKSWLSGAAADESHTQSDTGTIAVSGPLRVYFAPVMRDAIDAEHLLERLSLLAAFIKLQLEHLADLKKLAHFQQQIGVFAASIKESVSNIEIQYAYGTEQARALVSNLIIELRQLVAASEMEPELREVFETAIAEASERFTLLLQNGGAVDGEIAKLAETLEELERQ
ncbi:hypothetical protein [Gilvimarinus chinensis]|uniref:hypothetical protein n=1 Tax=Gilvimarinus chinensis TaxID=396005 RepID=UPI00037B2413|nr:hypothetical protein [Gilvimarinus chinensis]